LIVNADSMSGAKAPPSDNLPSDRLPVDLHAGPVCRNGRVGEGLFSQ
jgi:hypothetical protein